MELRSLTLALVAASLFCGCAKDDPPEVDLGYGYYPRQVGSWVEYQVDSLWRDDSFQILDSVSYRLLEKVVEAYTDPEGRPAFRIHRFIQDTDGNWVIRDVWTSTKDEQAAEMTEENLRRLKLSFPVRSGRTWNTNVYNPEEEFSVGYLDIGAAWSAMGLSYANTVLVKNTVPPNFVIKRNLEERYADGIGMVSKYREESETQSTGVKGWRLKMIAVSYGNN